MITDQQILDRHDVLVRPRCRRELAIVHCLMDEAAKAGYTLEEFEEGPTTDLLDLLFNLDEARVIVKDATGKRLGCILLVFGNDGWDLISDYSTNLEDFIKPLTELSDNLMNGQA